jgi:peptidoglycan/LPS O-acetylase OafA/YrhL
MEKYFDLSSKYRFLIHLWSLAVEMQFYLLAPFLFIVMERLSKIQSKLGIFFLILLSVWSFISQTNHGALFGRLWQFFAGVLAFYWKSSRATSEKKFPGILMCLMLILLLFGEICDNKQLVHTLLVIISSLIVGWPSENVLLRANFLKKLGDCSYAIYLVHWPLITWHRYTYMDIYQDESEADFLGKRI